MREQMRSRAANIPALEHIFELKTPPVRRKAGEPSQKVLKFPRRPGTLQSENDAEKAGAGLDPAEAGSPKQIRAAKNLQRGRFILKRSRSHHRSDFFDLFDGPDQQKLRG
jgi:hypothetical protein